MNEANPIINYFVTQGVPLDTVVLLLMLPLVATLVAFFQQVIGIKAFGIYTPSIVTFAFYAMGIKYGAAAFICVIFVGMLMRFFIKKLRILYLPRVALTLSVIAISVLVLLVIGGYFRRTGFAAVSIFPLLIMITIAEKFVNVQIEKGGRVALILAVETLVISSVGYYLISWEIVRSIIMSSPWVVFLILPLNIFLGRWTGLRLSEYLRFREIFKQM